MLPLLVHYWFDDDLRSGKLVNFNDRSTTVINNLVDLSRCSRFMVLFYPLLQILETLRFLFSHKKLRLHVIFWDNSNALVSLADLEQAFNTQTMVYSATYNPKESLNFRFAGLRQSWSRQQSFKLHSAVSHLSFMKFSVQRVQIFQKLTVRFI